MTVLAPEHREDLKKSGLTDTTIEALQFAAVRPHDLKYREVESAYEIPYFDLSGKVNGFQRRKLFPPIISSSGTMKYWQAKDTLPHLYCPPIVNWQTVARTATTIMVIAEGEKKAAAACQQGLVTVGIGGVWCWTSTLESGDKLILPMLDEFQWTSRPVLICPDSDAWHDGNGVQILFGFFALAKELQQRGASVQFVRLPDLHGGKCGLDDWLLVPGHDVEHGWPMLERIVLDDHRFASLTAWWQKWKEKQATQSAIKQHDLDDLAVTDVAGLYTVRSATRAVTIVFDRLTDARGGVSAEVTVVLGATELLSGVDLGLKSDNGQTKLASSLKSFAPAIPWKLLLQQACSRVLKHYRRGEPSRRLNKETVVLPLRYSVNPFVFQKKPMILFADGGTGKSTLGLFCGMCVSVGASVAGISALKGKVLYLDYEDDADVHARRMQAIQAGHPELAAAEVDYQRCAEPLTKLLYPLVRKIQEDAITFLILDSLVAATGGDTSAEAVGKLFAALRVFNIDALCIGHVPKTQGEGQEHPRVYGSVFNQNYARMVWEVRKEQEVGEDTAILGLINWKSNLSRLHHSIGLKVTQNADNTRILYEPFELSQAAELKQSLPLPNRIRNLLDSDGMPRTSQQITDELNAKLGSVKTTLSNPRYKGFKWSMLGEGKEAKWTTIIR